MLHILANIQENLILNTNSIILQFKQALFIDNPKAAAHVAVVLVTVKPQYNTILKKYFQTLCQSYSLYNCRAPIDHSFYEKY